ncbi:acyl carrier protein [Streptomyces lunaelactis]|uniref:phosphopantetheine-binding protein n=1 Tax=Streptomyces lunaelactis TaxID=1535768 RepID=UPI00158502CC|nr:phosphopantetheine-binding protein [Streptomyces lunaelactis]NUK03401.1 acyl carrier protein [Streptomyces lunaelactis]NUK10414.1 acyl carrier protein [Streptomyces lunaelactis]NUK20143.1 acyl carrier protein [Streptomyces lunaelactis]NUK27029.1 acyl carrier protein [Streptomyces lunaelactis]NUK38664.1 acyl carrier protein [Streptomyces lunaelactis]
MRTVVDLISLANEHLGTDLKPDDAGRELTELPCWDSVHLLRLVSLLETELGRQVPVAEMLEARSLSEIWTVAVGT